MTLDELVGRLVADVRVREVRGDDWAPILRAPVSGLVMARVLAVGLVTSWRARVLLPLGLLLSFVAVVAAYLGAPETSRGSECSDCGQYLGRYREPRAEVLALPVLYVSVALRYGPASRSPARRAAA